MLPADPDDDAFDALHDAPAQWLPALRLLADGLGALGEGALQPASIGSVASSTSWWSCMEGG